MIDTPARTADTDAPALASAATDPAVPVPPSWQLHLGDALAVHVPPRLTSLTTWILLEQERWFEQEFAFVQRLVAPDAWVLDIGANHGLYALTLAERLRGGRVIAFEPTAEPRERLCRSIVDNRLADRVAVAPVGLAAEARDVEFAVGADSELNSRHGATTARRESVRLERLDDFLGRHAPGRPIDFVKLDAEGEEPGVLAGGDAFFRGQSPVVMFELIHAGVPNTTVPGLFEALGYRIWRHLPGLEVLVPWRMDTGTAQEPPLNLFAVKPDRAAALAAAGLLADDDADAPAHAVLGASQTAAARAWLAGHAFAAGLADGDAGDTGAAPAWLAARDLLASVHADAALSAAERVRRCRIALALLQPALAATADPDVACATTAVHALDLLGRRHAAVALAHQVLAHWPRAAGVTGIPLPPCVADLDRARTTSIGDWLRLVLGEFVETHRAYSSYFAPADPLALRRLLRHPDHGAAIERRYALGEFRQNREPDAALLPLLRSGRGSRNAALWRAVLDTAPGA